MTNYNRINFKQKQRKSSRLKRSKKRLYFTNLKYVAGAAIGLVILSTAFYHTLIKPQVKQGQIIDEINTHPTINYTIQKGDSPRSIANKLGVVGADTSRAYITNLETLAIQSGAGRYRTFDKPTITEHGEKIYGQFEILAGKSLNLPDMTK